jgi:hypothetical protein
MKYLVTHSSHSFGGSALVSQPPEPKLVPTMPKNLSYIRADVKVINII